MGAVSDDFNRADGGLGANWAVTAGTWAVASNQCAASSASKDVAAYQTSTGNTDNWASNTLVSGDGGCVVRSSAAGSDCYFSVYWGGAHREIQKKVAGANTLLTSGTVSGGSGDLYMEVVGSSLEINFVTPGTPVTVTDTSITTGGYVGILSDSASTHDNFAGDDLGVDGAISHDAISENSTTDATSFTADTSWTHTPVGTPAAVIACITQPLASTDGVVGCTYGGVAMTRLISQARTVTEQMRVYIYGLFASIPTGAQTFAIDVSDASAKHGMIFTATVSGAGWTIDQDSENSADLGIIANPSITVTHTGTLSGWAGYAAHGYGAAAPVSTGLQTGETYQAGHDPGAATAMVYTRHGGADAASSTYGYTTLASDDQVIAAVVLKGVAPAAAGRPLIRRQPLAARSSARSASYAR